MATLNRAQIPTPITTVEQLLTWCQEILVFMAPAATIVVGPGESDLAVQSQQGRSFPLQTTAPNRYVYGGYLPKTSDSATLNTWTGVSEIATGAIPTQFRQAGT
jgi:hypothetical protein